MQCVQCTLYKLYTVQFIYCPCMHSAHLTNKFSPSIVYNVHCIVKWTICTLYVVQIVQSIIYPCPCTLYSVHLTNTVCLCTMYIVHSTMYGV